MFESGSAGGHFRDRVRERDLDNFLVEELQASEAFRAWFIGRLPSTFRPPAVAGVRLQKSPPRADRRQTDVRIGWFEEDRLAACVLIESKVTADFQPGQAEDYVREAERHRTELGDSHCCTVLVAPAAKLATLDHTGFDTTVTLEDIAANLIARSQQAEIDPELRARLVVRSELVEALAGKRAGVGWTPVTIAGKRDFAQAYADLAEKMAPELRVRASTDGPKALTRFFDGLRVPPDFPARVQLKHEFGVAGEMKYANLQLSGFSNAAEAVRSSGLLRDTPFSIARSAKSLFIRGATPGLDPMAEFDTQRTNVEAGIAMVKRLADWLAEVAPRLSPLLQSDAGPSPLSSRDEAVVEEDFHRAMLLICEQCIRIGYRPGYLLEMIGTSGGLAAAKTLLSRPQVSEGFGRLWELSRPDLTVEALILAPQWASLFTESERTIARRRLKGWTGLPSE